MTTTEAEIRAEAMTKILRSVEAKMAADGIKATLADYIKLLQMSKEMGDEVKPSLTVGWIEDPEMPPTGE
jgi:hypothetical protein